MADRSNLVTDIQAWLWNQDSNDFTPHIDRIIELAELRCARELEGPPFHVVSTALSLADGTSLYTVPTGLVLVKLFIVTTASGKRILEGPMDLGFIREYWPDQTLKDLPKYFAWYDATQWQLAPTPNAVMATEIHSKQRLAALTTAAPTNWLTINAYDALFAACRAEAARLLAEVNDGQDMSALIKATESAWQEKRDMVNAEFSRQRRDDYRPRPVKLENVGAG